MRKSAKTTGGRRLTSLDIMKAVQEKSGIPIRDIRDVTRAILIEIELAVTEGCEVVMFNFGNFNAIIRKGRTVKLTNPRTGGKFVSVQPDLPVMKFYACQDVRVRLKASYKMIKP